VLEALESVPILVTLSLPPFTVSILYCGSVLPMPRDPSMEVLERLVVPVTAKLFVLVEFVNIELSENKFVEVAFVPEELLKNKLEITPLAENKFVDVEFVVVELTAKRLLSTEEDALIFTAKMLVNIEVSARSELAKKLVDVEFCVTKLVAVAFTNSFTEEVDIIPFTFEVNTPVEEE
jgi:hypothetical protein